MGKVIVHQEGTALRVLFTLKLVEKVQRIANPSSPSIHPLLHFPILYQFKNNSAAQSILLNQKVQQSSAQLYDSFGRRLAIPL